MQSIQITPQGFQTIVASCMTGFAGEHFTEPREGSCLALANRVADRCMQLCEERSEDMSDALYDEAVRELAPHFAEE